jgi:hypothetical protein
MANQNIGEKANTTMQSAASNASSSNIGSTIRESARDSMRSVRDTASRVSESVSDRMNADEAREMMNRAGETATEFYDQAQGWMRDNSRMLYMVGGFVAVGIVGYILGRSFMSGRSEIENY